MKKLVISIIVIIGIAPLAATALFLIINLPNPDLEPGAALLITQAKVKHRVPGNAYYPLIGFRLTGTGTPAERGRAYADRVDSLSDNAREAYSDRAFEAAKKLPRIVRCEPAERACLSYFRKHRTTLRSKLGPYRPLLAAYRSIVHRYHRFYESTRDMAWLTGMGKVHRVYLYQMTQGWRPGHRKHVMTSLDRDIGFWRTILGNARTIVTKVYAAKMLREDYALMGELIDACSRCASPSDLPEVVKPLTARELDLGPAIDSTFLGGVKAVRKIYKAPAARHSAFLGFLSHENAMINALYDLTQDEIRVSRADDQDLDEMAKSVDDKYTSDHAGWWFSLFFHPAAKVIASIAEVDVTTYVKSVRSVEHVRARVAAKLNSRT